MGTIFTTETIRKELQRLDRITGYNGAGLEIRMCTGKSRLGYFAWPRKSSPYFGFSTTYFENEDFPDAEKIATVRHEYAHYMDFMENGYTSHGAAWKKCCARINVSSARCLQHSSVEFHKNQEKQMSEKQQMIKNGAQKLSEGAILIHPKFGQGTVISISGDTAEDTARISFDKVGEKIMSVEWLCTNLLPKTS